MNEPVNFEIAKLLKEKGFEQKERPSYLLVPFEECTNMDIFDHPTANLGYGDMIGYYLPNKTVNAPTIAEVVMWIYKKYGIWISVQKDWDEGECLGFEGIIDFIEGLISTKTVDSITEAYEIAIDYTLENFYNETFNNNEQQ
jgi:hypothetical protein